MVCWKKNTSVDSFPIKNIQNPSFSECFRWIFPSPPFFVQLGRKTGHGRVPVLDLGLAKGQAFVVGLAFLKGPNYTGKWWFAMTYQQWWFKSDLMGFVHWKSDKHGQVNIDFKRWRNAQIMGNCSIAMFDCRMFFPNSDGNTLAPTKWCINICHKSCLVIN